MRHLNNGTDHRHSKSCCDQSSPARRTIMQAHAVKRKDRHVDESVIHGCTLVIIFTISVAVNEEYVVKMIYIIQQIANKTKILQNKGRFTFLGIYYIKKATKQYQIRWHITDWNLLYFIRCSPYRNIWIYLYFWNLSISKNAVLSLLNSLQRQTIHCNDAIMSAVGSQITSVSIVCSTVEFKENIKAPRDRWIPSTKGQ